MVPAFALNFLYFGNVKSRNKQQTLLKNVILFHLLLAFQFYKVKIDTETCF